MDWVDIVGWAGAALVLAAYGLVSTSRIDGSSATYQLLNLFGGIGMLINGYVRGAYPSVAVNIVWIGIGGYFLFKALAKRRPVAQ